MTDVAAATGAETPGAAAFRRRSTRAVFAAVAFGTTGYIASVTVSPLIGAELANSATLSGLPWAAGILGTGLGSALLGQMMARRGRGPGLVVGYLVGAAGSAGAILATVSGLYVAFVGAILLMGIGNASNHLARYAASELYPLERRAQALGTVVWAGTVGGVAGPALLAPSGDVAGMIDLPRLTGPFLVAAVGLAVAGIGLLALIRRAPAALSAQDSATVGEPRRLLDMWRVPRAQAALIALSVSQTVMILIMAMTPLHMRMHGHGLGSVGVVISVHVFGMYGLSPVSGWVGDRFGRVSAILLGFGLLATAGVTAAVMPGSSGLALTAPLFLLGFGWSLSFVSASALLTEGLSYGDRTRLQGATDSVVWTAAAVAGLGSGVLVGAFGYAVLCLIGAALVAAPIAIITGRRRALAAQPA